MAPIWCHINPSRCRAPVHHRQVEHGFDGEPLASRQLDSSSGYRPGDHHRVAGAVTTHRALPRPRLERHLQFRLATALNGNQTRRYDNRKLRDQIAVVLGEQRPRTPPH
jgi:hypothetical protein